MKFNPKDRISLAGIPGTVIVAYEGTYARAAMYEVTFDGHVIGGALGDELRANRFTAPWFDAHAEPYTDPEPKAADFFAGLLPGDRFTVKNVRDSLVWDTDYITYLSDSYENGSGVMIRGIRHILDTVPEDLFIRDNDKLTKLE